MSTKPLIFKLRGRKHRLSCQWGWEWERGYAEPAQIADNVFEVWSWWRGWVELERERIPTHVWIHAACFCGDTGGWRSDLVRRVEEMKAADWQPFG